MPRLISGQPRQSVIGLFMPCFFLASGYSIGKPAAFDLTVVSPLNSSTLNEAGATSGSAAGEAEARNHNANDHKCRELGWVGAVETYGYWGEHRKK